jgi:hypothetical protein
MQEGEGADEHQKEEEVLFSWLVLHSKLNDLNRLDHSWFI